MQDGLEQVILVVRLEGRLPRQHLVQQHSQSPPVHGRPVLQLLQDLNRQLHYFNAPHRHTTAVWRSTNYLLLINLKVSVLSIFTGDCDHQSCGVVTYLSQSTVTRPVFDYILPATSSTKLKRKFKKKTSFLNSFLSQNKSTKSMPCNVRYLPVKIPSK